MASDPGVDVPVPDAVEAMFADGRMRIASLSTVRPDGGPAVVPVGVLVKDGRLHISTPTRTKKVRNLRRDPRVAVCITDPHEPSRYVLVTGRAELADDVDREFVDWVARTYMGVDEYPYEPRTVARTVITVRAERYSMPKVHGSDA